MGQGLSDGVVDVPLIAVYIELNELGTFRIVQRMKEPKLYRELIILDEVSGRTWSFQAYVVFSPYLLVGPLE